jgi:hypothetical protein
MPEPARLRPVARVLLTAYRLTLSPAFMALGVRCRHEPSCSHYAAEAVSRHGIWRGGWLGLARLCRCRPGGSAGWDPVPEATPPARWWQVHRLGDWKGPDRAHIPPEPPSA